MRGMSTKQVYSDKLARSENEEMKIEKERASRPQ